jgi:hypothetical protein
MGMSRLNLPTLLMAFIGGLVALYDAQGLAASLAGLALLTALVAYDERGLRNDMQSLAFAFVCGLAALCSVSYPLHALLGDSGLAILPAFLAKEFSAAIWLFATVIFWFIDRARMNSRQSLSLGAVARMPTMAYPVAQQPVRETRIFAPAPQQPIVQPQTAVPQAEPVYVPEPIPIAAGLAPIPIPVAAETVPTPSAPQPVFAPAPQPPRPSGKPATIYVNMLGEGMNLMRPVQAENLGRDFYIIVDEMPADETWEFVPGQVVRCRKKTLSHGKAMVAYEEAPRAQ